jgi:hypothetical protein
MNNLTLQDLETVLTPTKPEGTRVEPVPVIVNVAPAEKTNYLPFIIGGMTAGIVSSIVLMFLATRKRD